MPAALQKPLSSSRPEMVAAHVPLALHDGVLCLHVRLWDYHPINFKPN